MPAGRRHPRVEEITIDAVFNNDIIGNSAGGNGIVDSRTVRVFSEAPADSPERAQAPAAKMEEASFNFEGFGGMLVDDEQEGAEDEGSDEAEEAPAEAEEQESNSGLAIEGVLAASYDFSGQDLGVGGAVSGGGLEVEQPLSEMESNQAAEWTRRGAGDDEPAETAPAEPRRDDERGAGRGERPPRARPASPERKESSVIPALLVIGVLLVLSSGGRLVRMEPLPERRAGGGGRGGGDRSAGHHPGHPGRVGARDAGGGRGRQG